MPTPGCKFVPRNGKTFHVTATLLNLIIMHLASCFTNMISPTAITLRFPIQSFLFIWTSIIDFIVFSTECIVTKSEKRVSHHNRLYTTVSVKLINRTNPCKLLDRVSKMIYFNGRVKDFCDVRT